MTRNFVYKRLAVFGGVGLLYVVGQYFRGYWWPNFTWPFHCYQIIFGNQSYCDALYSQTLGWPLIATGEVFAIIGLMLLFANERGFRSWLKMSFWFVPIATFLVIFVTPLLVFPVNAHASYDGMVWLFGYLYIFITFFLVIRHRFFVHSANE